MTVWYRIINLKLHPETGDKKMIGSVGNGNRIIYEGFKEWQLENAQTRKRKKKNQTKKNTIKQCGDESTSGER